LLKEIFKKLAALLLGLILGLLIIEGLLRLFPFDAHPRERSKRIYKNNKYHVLNQDGLRVGIPGDHPIKRLRLPNREVIYQVVYSIGLEGNRITPKHNPDNDKKAALFLGCSFTIGEGVNNDETIPYYFGKYADDWSAYNYAAHGGGPFDMLARLETMDFSSIKEPVEAVVYIFPYFHLERISGEFLRAQWNAKQMFYNYDPVQKRFIRKGPLAWVFPFKLFIAKHFKIYRLLVRAKVWPFYPSESQLLRDTANIFSQMESVVADKFPDAQFIFVLYPNKNDPGKLIELMKENNKIHILDYSKLFDPSSPNYYLAPEDKHPTPRANSEFAKKLAEDMAALLRTNESGV
jgi:hypothetical protein